MKTKLASCALLLALMTACASNVPQAVPRAALSDQNAGSWRTWVLTSGREVRLSPPPDASATAAELEQLRGIAGQLDAKAQERIAYWGYSSPSYRWNEVLTDILAARPIGGGGAMRTFAMLNVAINDAMVAAWDSKYAHNRARPGDMDSRFALPASRSPSYPCEYSVAAGAAAAVIAHIYPAEAQRISSVAEEAAHSRVLAGAAFPSDTKAGLELGRAVAARVVARMKIDDTKWAGTVPTGPGLWKGTNPVGVNEVSWPLFVMTASSQFRPAAPYAHDSPQRAAELAETKNFKRTPFTNSKVFYWQFGQLGLPGVTFRLSEEVGRRLSESGTDASAPRAARAYALVHVAQYEGWIASQDAKFHYWTARPNQFDPTLTTVIPTPPFPTYPSNAATLVKAPAVVLSYLFPQERTRYDEWVREFGESRLWAGIHFRSDIQSGSEIGRQVGDAVVARARGDGS
jgi:membrane-associated phospholipid phosphatase